MKLTAHKSTLNLSLGDSARSSFQHCSSAATQGPASRPSTLKVTFPRFFSVVILNMPSSSIGCIGCTGVSISIKILEKTKPCNYYHLQRFAGFARGEIWQYMV